MQGGGLRSWGGAGLWDRLKEASLDNELVA